MGETAFLCANFKDIQKKISILIQTGGPFQKGGSANSEFKKITNMESIVPEMRNLVFPASLWVWEVLFVLTNTLAAT